MEYPADAASKGGGMRIFHLGKKQMPAFFMPGFILGIIYVNFFTDKYMAEQGIFTEYFLSRLLTVRIDPGGFMFYVLRVRLAPLCAVALLAMTKLRRASAVFFLVWTGFTAGVAVSSAVAGLGLKGCLLCAAALIPQFLFYVPAYVILLRYCLGAPQVRWNRQKSIGVALMTAAGIILEIYVNPSLVRGLLSFFQNVV